jgi:glycosyltransferase involved in cell wall biosynthesis
MPTIVAMGHFDLEGGRSWVLRKGLEEHGWTVTLCRTEAKGVLGKYRDLTRQWNVMKEKPDAVYVPFLGHWTLPLTWRLARKQKIPIVFDAFLSLYDTEVCDRKRLPRWHPKAWFLWWTDWLCCRLCDVVLLDTEEHKQYFAHRYKIPAEKILALPIGCRTDLFTPGKAPAHREECIVAFHGTFIPLQGIDTILRAARLLQDAEVNVRFRIIGKGQTSKAMHALASELALQHVEFRGAIPMAELPELLHDADICLGIFGTTAKADRVIPNKAYEILNAGKPLLTGRTTAAMRVLKDGDNALLCEPGNPQALADAILRLRDDPALRKHLAENGHRLSLQRFQPRAIVEPLAEWLSKATRR